MSLFNKNLTLNFLLIFMLVWVQCSNPERKNINYKSNNSFELKRNSLIVEDSVYANKVVCFYTSRCCPTCVMDVKNYSESIIDCSDVFFFTDKIDSSNVGFSTIISPKVIKVNKRWENIEKPLLFQTDENGKIYNMLEIEYNKPYEVKEYLLNIKK